MRGTIDRVAILAARLGFACPAHQSFQLGLLARTPAQPHIVEPVAYAIVGEGKRDEGSKKEWRLEEERGAEESCSFDASWLTWPGRAEV